MPVVDHMEEYMGGIETVSRVQNSKTGIRAQAPKPGESSFRELNRRLAVDRVLQAA
jgi:hypothetical protein